MNAITSTALYTAAITVLQTEIAHLRCWAPSVRRDVLIAEREEAVAELMECMTVEAEVVEVEAEADAEAVEISAALEAAIVDAQATGCALVKGAPSMLRELERVAPGCVTKRGELEIATVATEGGELRLVRRNGSYRGAMSWRAA
jgi:hypothetical protein